MNKTKTKNTTCVVKTKEGKIVGYLTWKHEEQGLDAELDMKGYIIEVID